MMFCAKAGRRPAGRDAGRSTSTIRRIVLVGLAITLGALLWSGGDARAQRYGGGTGGTSTGGDSGGTSGGGGGGSPTGGGGPGPSGGGGRSNGGGSGQYRPYEPPGRFGGGPYGGGPYGGGDGWSGRRYFPGGGYGRFGGGGYGGYGPDRGFGRYGRGGYGGGYGRFRDGDRYGDDGGPGMQRWPRRQRPPFARGAPYGPRDANPRDYGGPPVRYVTPHPNPRQTIRPADAAPMRTAAPPVIKATRPVAPRTRVAAPPPIRPIVPPAAPSRPPPAASAAVTDSDHVPNEVLLELRPNQPDSTITAVAAQFRLTRIAAQRIDLLDTTVYRYRVPAGRTAAAVVQALRGDRRVALAQLNGKYRLQADDAGAPRAGGSAPPPMQWSVDKLQLAAVHDVSTGRDVLIAMIDSGVDVAHPELTGDSVSLLDTLNSPFVPHEHGTAIAGALLAHGQLTGVAPGARILGIRTFDAKASEMGAEGTSIHIAKALDLADRARARVLNLSFAGPQDDLLARMFTALHQKGVVIVAAAGNAGPTSPPLYPAADPNVIAVTATDAKDALYGSANRGSYICIAAPGVDILEPAPDASYQFTSGTSVAAAHVSGVVALLLARQPDLDPDAVRKALVETADLLGSGASPDQFGSGLVDAVRAVHRFDPALPAVRSAKAPDASGAPQPVAPEAPAPQPAAPAADPSDDIPAPKP